MKFKGQKHVVYQFSITRLKKIDFCKHIKIQGKFLKLKSSNLKFSSAHVWHIYDCNRLFDCCTLHFVSTLSIFSYRQISVLNFVFLLQNQPMELLKDRFLKKMLLERANICRIYFKTLKAYIILLLSSKTIPDF